ncbi:unnamed protein product [Fraxinus pennsylvanica]|uniref:Uncharacterized protein n=1 Tax=Fraxinus pennsylvanica TaxID=56036 RepID=A0AAD2DKG1_9LAMI|nr:unnamed protein product [Fraxinus pennsylvanica]
MGRTPCCEKNGLKKGPWTPEEDKKLIDYIHKNGSGNWRILPRNAGLQRCGKSCRLRWANYLRPDIKRGKFSFHEEEAIIQLHRILGNKWSAIAGRLPGRTDNEIKNHWNTHIRKKLLRMGIDPVTHHPRLDLLEISDFHPLVSPNLLDENYDTAVTNYEYYGSGQSIVNPPPLETSTFQSNMSTPSSSSTTLHSNSTYITEDIERESNCSNVLNFQISDILDVNEFM